MLGSNNHNDDYRPMSLPQAAERKGKNPERRFYQMSIFLLISLLALNLWYSHAVEAQKMANRYLILQNQYVFERTSKLPYEILRPMCWSSETGWCDEGMEQLGRRLYYLIDYETDRYGVVMQNDSGCWLWWFLEDYGEDNNPHIAEDYWITCPEPLNQGQN